MNRASNGAAPAQCPACAQRHLRAVGPIFHPAPTCVAGVPIDLSDLDLTLWRCEDCAFQFKWPAIPAERLMACYAAAPGDHWGAEVDPQQRNFDRVAAAISRHARGRRVLDIGCFNGAFLAYLGPEWQTFGVEPSEAAAQTAAHRGVQVLGKTLDDVPAQHTFDVIIAMDVIEHILEPAPFFARVGAMLSPNGIFVVTTGDTGRWSFRLQQNRYWYCAYLPEHVSFYQKRTMQTLAARSGMQSVEHRAISHKRTTIGEQFSQGFKGVIFAGGMRLGWFGMPALRRKLSRRAGTNWIAARDHMIHVMRRPE